MTLIVGIETEKGVVLACDSSMQWDGAVRRLHADTPKIALVDGLLWGVAGQQAVLDAIRFGMRLPKKRPPAVDPIRFATFDLMAAVRFATSKHAKRAIEGDAGWALLLGVGERLYEIDTTFAASRQLCGYSAIGTGARVALGSLHSTSLGTLDARARAIRACEAAAEHDAGVAPPFVVLSTDPTT